MLDALNRFRALLSRALAAVAAASLAGMVALACANMALRFFGHPIDGAFELMGFLGGLTAALSLGYSQLHKGHIAVSLLSGKLPPALKRVLDALGHLGGALFFLIGGWEVFKLADFLVMSGELSETLRMPYHPFVYAAGVGCLVMGLVLIVDFLMALAGRDEEKLPA
ncbi:TRAP transporter small permease [Desulfohalovibrio reitneri]|uniref:TRAP transporter small permease n=1 Tax=Desulfohalovibrio reitneri TaxID=1307759 RepID=UPI0004A6F7F5|nr:TRAP transporter small permease [Desulfohalovibrio reitneri]